MGEPEVLETSRCGRDPTPAGSSAASGHTPDRRRKRRRRAQAVCTRASSSRLDTRTAIPHIQSSGGPERYWRDRSTARPCSWPSTPIAAGREQEQRAVDGSRPSQRAVSTRSMWPWEKTSTSPSAGSAASTRVSARADSAARLAAGAAVAPEVPAGPALANLRGGQALVVAVVPLAQLARRSPSVEAREPRGLERRESAGCSRRPRSAGRRAARRSARAVGAARRR